MTEFPTVAQGFNPEKGRISRTALAGEIDTGFAMMNNNLDSVYEDVVWTPFYRTMPDVVPSGCTEEPDFNYTSYTLFVLRTRIVPWLDRNFDSKISARLPSAKKNDRMYITVVPFRGDTKVEMTSEMIRQLQDEVNRLTSKPLKAALLVSAHRFLSNPPVSQISSSWIDSIVPYIGINKDLNPHMNEEGILVELDRTIDYLRIYNKLLINTIEKIREMYDDGYIVDPPEDVVENWRLLSADDDHRLYHPDWSDQRITARYGGMLGFLQSRIMGDPTIDFFVGSNLVHRHHIAESLASKEIDVTFVGQYARINVPDLTTARRVASVIERATKTGHGKIAPMFASRQSWIMLYFAAAAEQGMTNCVGYMISDPSRPYVFSCEVDFGTNIYQTTDKIYRRAITLSISLESRLVSVLDTLPSYQREHIGIHDALELGYLSISS